MVTKRVKNRFRDCDMTGGYSACTWIYRRAWCVLQPKIGRRFIPDDTHEISFLNISRSERMQKVLRNRIDHASRFIKGSGATRARRPIPSRCLSCSTGIQNKWKYTWHLTVDESIEYSVHGCRTSFFFFFFAVTCVLDY